MAKVKNMSQESFEELLDKDAFIPRHIGLSDDDCHSMLKQMGYCSGKSFIDEVIPESIRLRESLDLANPLPEKIALAELYAMGSKNKNLKSMIGQGYYGTHMPHVILRNVFENPAWYTAYTPYQAEISQGRLEAALNFQTMIVDLTGLEIANSSLLDEATAAAEAMVLCRRQSKKESRAFFVDKNCFVQTREVVKTRAEMMNISVIEGDALTEAATSDAFAILIQYPGADGDIKDFENLARALAEKNIFVIVAADLLSLCVLKPPGEWGADVVVGSAQRFGVSMGFGGPHAAFISIREKWQRQLPGRITGVSIDSKGRSAYRMALQTREQHIRREKATSNVCTAQALLANIAGFYAIYHGRDGLKRIAERVHVLTAVMAAGLEKAGLKKKNAFAFDTVQWDTTGKTEEVLKRAIEKGYNFFRAHDNAITLSLDETSQREDVEAVWEIFAPANKFSFDALLEEAESLLPENLQRCSDYLQHPVFNRYRSETDMLRYLRLLADKDLALDRSMIPLGSCTMKLNATSEMIPITWPCFSDIHPFAPQNQTEGYREMIASLEEMLCKITGFDAISFQPNSGAQGEYAGLRAIRHYLESKGEADRNICLIPVSAHGTNPASAVMAGLTPIAVECDSDGDIDIKDLQKKIDLHKGKVAAFMVTYPSTHGVFEADIVEMCQKIHDAGGQVYMDGANLNAQIGWCQPAKIGADVSHMNLHKTFCIPHGGGGPGVGPIGVCEHLKPFLPGHVYSDGEKSNAVSAAPWGSAGILPISWMYIAMMGGKGLKEASYKAILAANYISWRMEKAFKTLYHGTGGHVAHECIFDIRPFEKIAGITVEDIAKRLIDYGFHAPTMSFPVAGTLMIEPTESESLEEIDRLCDALLSIRQEIKEIEDGKADAKDNVLKNAPHTASDIAGEWTHAYAREKAVFPVSSLYAMKYWPVVSRIDNVYGDRHLFCVCPPVEGFLKAAE